MTRIRAKRELDASRIMSWKPTYSLTDLQPAAQPINSTLDILSQRSTFPQIRPLTNVLQSIVFYLCWWRNYPHKNPSIPLAWFVEEHAFAQYNREHFGHSPNSKEIYSHLSDAKSKNKCCCRVERGNCKRLVTCWIYTQTNVNTRYFSMSRSNGSRHFSMFSSWNSLNNCWCASLTTAASFVLHTCARFSKRLAGFHRSFKAWRVNKWHSIARLWFLLSGICQTVTFE